MFHSRWEGAIREKQLIIKSAFLLNGKTGRSCGTTNGKVLPNGNFMEKQKGVTSDVFLFSRVYRNDRNITEPFASSHSRTMLQNYQWKEPFHLIPRHIRTVPFGGKFSTVFPHMESTQNV